MNVTQQADLPVCPACNVHPVHAVQKCVCGACDDLVHLIFCESCGTRRKAFDRDRARELWRKAHEA